MSHGSIGVDFLQKLTENVSSLVTHLRNIFMFSCVRLVINGIGHSQRVENFTDIFNTQDSMIEAKLKFY